MPQSSDVTTEDHEAYELDRSVPSDSLPSSPPRVSHELSIALLVMAISVCVTLLILADGCARGHGPSCTGSVSIILAACDLGAGVVFTWVAWGELAIITAETSEYGVKMRLIAYLCTAAVSAPVLLSLFALSCTAQGLRNCIDSARFDRNRLRNTLVLALSPVNLELLRLTPWHENAFDEFPTWSMFMFTIPPALIPDALLITAQVLFIQLTHAQDMDNAVTLLIIAVISFTCSALSLWFRGLRKLLGRVCATEPPESRTRPYWMRDTSIKGAATDGNGGGQDGHSPYVLPQRGVEYDGPAEYAPRKQALHWLSEEEELSASRYQGGVSVEGEPLAYPPRERRPTGERSDDALVVSRQ